MDGGLRVPKWTGELAMVELTDNQLSHSCTWFTRPFILMDFDPYGAFRQLGRRGPVCYFGTLCTTRLLSWNTGSSGWPSGRGGRRSSSRDASEHQDPVQVPLACGKKQSNIIITAKGRSWQIQCTCRPFIFERDAHCVVLVHFENQARLEENRKS